jgi:hypothetical protein
VTLDHKKKIIFFIFVNLMMMYVDGYARFMHWFKFKEPFKKKLRRWIIGKKYDIPETIKEQNIDAV